MYDSSSSFESKTNLNKYSNSLNHSSELIKTTNIDFNVYSIYCDIQNVFYLSGAKKPASKTFIMSSIANEITESSNHKKSSGHSKQESTAFKSEKKNMHGISSSKSGSSSMSKSHQPVSSSTINTRRRAAQAAATGNNCNQFTTNAASANSNNTGQHNLDTSYLFNNNDDLYEA